MKERLLASSFYGILVAVVLDLWHLFGAMGMIYLMHEPFPWKYMWDGPVSGIFTFSLLMFLSAKEDKELGSMREIFRDLFIGINAGLMLLGLVCIRMGSFEVGIVAVVVGAMYLDIPFGIAWFIASCVPRQKHH